MPWFARTPKSPLTAAETVDAAGATCPNCGTVNPAGARFCNQCGQRLDGVTQPVVAPPHAHHAEHEQTEERRVVTILFADLANSTMMGDTMDAEELRSLLAHFFALMADQIHQHGGIVEKFIGDAVMGVFGLPRVHEDDPVRAVRAALGMQAALAAFNAARRQDDRAAPELVMRIGVNTGDVVAATGPAEGRDFLVTGDAVNVAARLQQIAENGTVIVGPRTFRDSQGTVEYRALPPVELKGKPRPVRVWQPLSMMDLNPVAVARVRSLDEPRAPLIGRTVEMKLLQTVLARAVADRRPHVITIIGAPGVGKTRLAREFISQTRGGSPAPTVLIGRCALYGEGITFWPLVEMIREYCEIAPTMSPESSREHLLRCVTETLQTAGRDDDPASVAQMISYTLGLETVERQQEQSATVASLQDGIIRAWRVFFEAVAAAAPLILMVDDIHWADEALLDLLEQIAARASGWPIIILCTARPDLLEWRTNWGGAKRDYVMVALEPLTTDQSSRLVSKLVAGDALPAELRQSILRRAEGNPFFIEEIVRMLMDRGVLAQKDGHWQVSLDWRDRPEVCESTIPDTVQGVLAARIDLLPAIERDILRHASVIGRTFWPSALRGIAAHLSWEDLDAGLHSLIDKDLIVPATDVAQTEGAMHFDEPRYLFKHVLTRDVAYDAMPRVRRAHEHEHFAEWLETFAQGREEEYAELLARHFEEYYRQAGLARSRNPERRQVVREKVIGYLHMAGEEALIRHAPSAAIKYYTRAISLLLEDSVSARQEYRTDLVTLYTRRGDARAIQSDGDHAWQDYRSALQIWLPGQTELTPDEQAIGMRLYRRLVTLPARYASWFRKPPPHDELSAYLDAGLALAEAAGDMDSLDRVALLTAKTFFWWATPQGRGREQIREALHSAEEAVAIAEKCDAPREASEALDALGNMQATTTDLCGHLASQTRRLFWAQRIENPNEIVDIHNEVSAAHQMVGEYARAVDHARIGLAEAEQLENDIMRAQALQRLVIAYFEWDHWQSAITDGEQFLAVAARTPMITQNHYRWGALGLVIALVRTGRIDRADQILRQLNTLPAISESQYVPVFRARLQVARGNLAEAERMLKDALEIGAGRHSYPMLLAELAELGARQGRRDLTDTYLKRAINIGERSCARKPLAQAIRARGLVALAAGQFADAERDLVNALDRYEALGTPWDEARTRYVMAELWRRIDGADGRANAFLTQALHLFDQVGAVKDIARAKAALAGGDIRLP